MVQVRHLWINGVWRSELEVSKELMDSDSLRFEKYLKSVRADVEARKKKGEQYVSKGEEVPPR